MDETPEPPDAAAAADTCAAVLDRVGDAVVVDREVLEIVTAAVLARGHVLIEDVPGTGKTLTARLLAGVLGLSFSRVQFTPDLLPSDVTGTTVYDEHAGEFSFAAGPVFANVVLADEINRAPPKTQAALLEAMEERQVTVDGETHPLPEPFVVLATQNPVEQEGTFRLPEAQRDRFLVETALGYPDRAGELELLDRRASRRTLAPTVDALLSPAEVRALQRVPEGVHVDGALREYVVDLGRATRDDDRVATGVSPRGVQRVFEVTRARAVVRGRDYAVPDDVKTVAVPAMAHRLVLATEASVGGVTGTEVVRDVLDRVPVPGMDRDVSSGASESRSSHD
jgi:MoxR-like ATPase